MKHINTNDKLNTRNDNFEGVAGVDKVRENTKFKSFNLIKDHSKKIRSGVFAVLASSYLLGCGIMGDENNTPKLHLEPIFHRVETKTTENRDKNLNLSDSETSQMFYDKGNILRRKVVEIDTDGDGAVDFRQEMKYFYDKLDKNLIRQLIKTDNNYDGEYDQNDVIMYVRDKKGRLKKEMAFTVPKKKNESAN